MTLQPKRRRCIYCEGPISQHRPVFLITTEGQRYVGPFHAGCADRVVSAQKELRDRKLELAITFGKRVQVAREETLPW